jgi:DNA (cytosine-5)-methyltransferase 1
MSEINQVAADLLTIDEASKLINVNPETLRRWDRCGEFPAIRIGRRKDRRYNKNEILRLLQRKASNKLRVVSLFSGCGGLDLGFRGDFEFLGKYYAPHNYEIVWANDIDAKSCQTYKNNFKTDHIICGDFTELIKNPNNIPDCDVIVGGFPCQDFSVAGKRGGLNTKRGKLYLSMRDLIISKKPMAFIAENVKGLLNIGKGEIIKLIQNDFKQAGYKVSVNLYNSANYGVPEIRERVIIVGIRNDLAVVFTPPKPTHAEKPSPSTQNWVSAREALDTLRHLKEGEFSAHYWSKAAYLPGTQGNNKISANRPGPTMRAEHHGNIEYHYELSRRLSAREAARIQSFPDNFEFFKSTSDAYRQIGNAVAPLFAWHIAGALYDSLTPILTARQAHIEPKVQEKYNFQKVA